MEISKKDFCRLGGTENPNCYRKQDKNKRWRYYKSSKQSL